MDSKQYQSYMSRYASYTDYCYQEGHIGFRQHSDNMKEYEMEQLKQKLSDKDKAIEKLIKDNENLKNKSDTGNNNKGITAKLLQFMELEKSCAAKDKTISDLREELNNRSSIISAKDEEIEGILSDLGVLHDKCSEAESRIECMQKDFQSKCQTKDMYIETLKNINQGLVLKLKREESLLAESTQAREMCEQECAEIIKSVEMDKDQEIQELKDEITKLKDTVTAAMNNPLKLDKGEIEEVTKNLDNRLLANDSDADACIKNELKSEELHKSTIQLEKNGPKKEELEEIEQFFADLKFELAGLPLEVEQELVEWITEIGGEVMLSDYQGTVDYLITPLEGHEGKLKHKEHLTYYWVDDCIDQCKLVPIEYFHYPIKKKETAPLQGIVTCISGYANKERIYIGNAISILGGIPQDMFAKKKKIDKGMLASTHLVCNGPEGPKYNAALNWGVPVVNKDWVRACLKEWKWISEKPFLIGKSTTFNKDKPLPTLPVEYEVSLVEDADDKEATVKESADDKEATVEESAVDNEATVEESADDKDATVEESADDKDATVEESADDKEATVEESADDKDATVEESAVDNEATVEESAVQEDGDQEMDNSNWYWQYGTSVITRTAARFDQMPAGKLKISIVLDQDIISMINDIKFDSVSKSVSYLEDQMDYDNNKAMTKSKDDMKKEKNEDEANQAEDNVEEDGREGVSESKDTARDSTLKPAIGKRSRSAERPIPAVKKIKKNSIKNEERQKCEHCEKQIKKNYLKSHIRDVHKKVKVGCPCCDKQFSHSSLRYHIKQEHSNECTRCLECNKSVIATDMLKHMKKKHKIDQVNKPGKKDYHSSTVKNQKEKWVITPLQKSINRLNKVKNGGKVLALKASNKLVPNKAPKIKEDIDKMLWERMAALHEEGGSHNLTQKSATDQVDVNDKENIHAAVNAVNDSPNGTEDKRVRNQIHQEIVGVVNKSSNVLGDNNKVDLYGSKDPVMTEKSSDQPIIQDKKTKMLKYVQVFEERMAFKQSQCSLKCKAKICSGCEAKCRKICRSCKRMLVEKKAFTETSEIEWANNLLDCALDRFLGGLN